jgi:hypothetical protein
MTNSRRLSVPLALATLFVAGIAAPTEARYVRSRSRTTVNRDVNINRNVNVNVDRDVHVHGGYYGGYYGGCCYHDYHPVATAAAVTATAMVTAAVVGSIVHTLPPSCTSVIVNGFAYQHCGSTWYQPQISGGSTTYVVVNAPR